MDEINRVGMLYMHVTSLNLQLVGELVPFDGIEGGLCTRAGESDGAESSCQFAYEKKPGLSDLHIIRQTSGTGAFFVRKTQLLDRGVPAVAGGSSVLVYSYGFLPIRGWSYGTSHVSWVEPNPGQGGFAFARLRNPFFFSFPCLPTFWGPRRNGRTGVARFMA